MSKKKVAKDTKNLVFIILLVLIGLTIFIQTTTYDFVWDDNPLYLNQTNYPVNNAFGKIEKFWTLNEMPMFAPVTYTTWSIITGFSSENKSNTFNRSPVLFHFVNVILHIINSILIFQILLTLFKNKTASFSGALIFLIHPLAVESVAWISELRGLLSACFGFLAIFLFLQNSISAAELKKSKKKNILTYLLIILSFLSKPSGIIFPLILIVLDYFSLSKSKKEKLITYLTSSIFLILFLFLSVNSESNAQKFVAPELWTRALLPFFSFIFYVIKFVLPVDLSAVYGLTPNYLTQQSIIYIYPVLFLILSVLIFIFRKKTPIIILGFVIAFISTLPTSGLIPFYYQTFSTVADRYFYIPLLGMSIIVAYIVGHVLNEKYRITAISIIGIILGLISFNQANNWKSEFSHWNNVISKSSIGIPQAFMGRGEEWITKGRYNEAISDFSEAIKIDPEGHVYYYNRGNAYMDLKKFEKAISDYTRTIELNPKYIDAYINRGLTYSEMIDTNSKYLAINDFRNALKINPNQPDALNSIGVIYAQMGKFDSALSFFSEVVKLNPNDAEAIENLKQVKTEIQKRNK